MIETKAFPQGFGAEIAGFDVHAGCDPGDIAAIRAAFEQHHLLLFRDCGRIAPQRHVEMMAWLGPIGGEPNADGHRVSAMDNRDSAGARELQFHCDITYMRHPLDGISLHALELPPVPTSTTFVSNAVAWDMLAPDLQAFLGERTARHTFSDGTTLGFDWPAFEFWHPIRMRHRSTKRPLLFVTEHHVDRIEGMDEEEGGALLQHLFATLYAPPRRYEHVWQVGDLLVWDNLAIQHARTRAAPPDAGRRLLQRVTLGEHSFPSQLAALRRERSMAAA